MRIFLFLPDTAELTSALESCRKKYASLPWIAGDMPVAELVQRLQQDDCKQGYVVESFPNTLEALKELEEQLRAQASKPKLAKLPLHIYWAGKPKKENRDAIKDYRKEHKAAGDYLHEHRRLVSFLKPKKLAAAFKEAKKRSKPVQLIRRGVAVAAVAALVLFAIFFIFFRDMLIKCTLESQGAAYFQAKVDVASLSTSVSDAGLHISDMAVADHAAPMHNVFEFRQLDTSWDIAALSSGKLHAALLKIDGLQFNTKRAESGALPLVVTEEPELEPIEDLKPSEDADESSDFVEALNNTMGDFEPPKKEDLESTKAINKQKELAEQRRSSLDEKVAAIDVEKSIAQSKQALGNLKSISVLSPDASQVEADLAKNEQTLAVLQQEISVDVAAITKSVEELKEFKVDTKDLKKAKEMVDQAKDLADDIKQVKAKVKQAQDLVEQSQASAAKAADDIQAETEKARAELKQGIAAVKAPLLETQKQIDALAAESKQAAKELRAAQKDIQQAIDTDVAAAQKQYSVEGLKAGSEKLMEELIGESIYGQLQTALYYYRVIKPWLPVSEKTAKVSKRKVGKGHVYAFPIAAEDGGLAGMHIHEALITGVYPSGDESIEFQARVTDLTNNMAYTQKPVVIKGDGKSTGSKTMAIDMRCDLDAILRGSVTMRGLAVDGDQFSASSNGIAPQSLTGSSMDVQVSEIALGDGHFDALVAVDLSDLKLGAASGAGVHPEIAAVFNDVYAQLSALRIVLGVGRKKHFETQPNVSKMLSDALNQRVSAQLEATKQQAEQQIRAYGADDLKAIENLAGSFDSLKGLEEKQAALTKGNESIDALTGAEGERINKDGAAAAGSLTALTDKIKQQQDAVAGLENSLGSITKKIDKEKKRIEKEILGGGLKKFLPKF